MLCEFVTTFVPSPVLFTYHKRWVNPFLLSCFHHMEANAKPTLELTERNCRQLAPLSCVKWNIFLFFEKEIFDPACQILWLRPKRRPVQDICNVAGTAFNDFPLIMDTQQICGKMHDYCFHQSLKTAPG